MEEYHPTENQSAIELLIFKNSDLINRCIKVHYGEPEHEKISYHVVLFNKNEKLENTLDELTLETTDEVVFSKSLEDIMSKIEDFSYHKMMTLI